MLEDWLSSLGHCNGSPFKWGFEDYIPPAVIYYWRQQITKLGIRRLGLCSCCVSMSYPPNLFFPICAMGTNINLPNHWAGVITKWNDLSESILQAIRFLLYSFLSEYGAQGKALWVYLIFSIFIWVKQSGSNLNKSFQACIKFLYVLGLGTLRAGRYDHKWRHHKLTTPIPKEKRFVHGKRLGKNSDNHDSWRSPSRMYR